MHYLINTTISAKIRMQAMFGTVLGSLHISTDISQRAQIITGLIVKLESLELLLPAGRGKHRLYLERGKPDAINALVAIFNQQASAAQIDAKMAEKILDDFLAILVRYNLADEVEEG